MCCDSEKRLNSMLVLLLCLDGVENTINLKYLPYDHKEVY